LLEAIDTEPRRSGIIDARRQCPDGQLHQLLHEEGDILGAGPIAPDDEHLLKRLVVRLAVRRRRPDGQQRLSLPHECAGPRPHPHHDVPLTRDVQLNHADGE
jgi:hypothetical protein